MMNRPEKSDSAVRAMKPANKAGQPAAERVEQRAGTKGNTNQPRSRRKPKTPPQAYKRPFVHATLRERYFTLWNSR